MGHSEDPVLGRHVRAELESLASCSWKVWPTSTPGVQVGLGGDLREREQAGSIDGKEDPCISPPTPTPAVSLQEP